MPRKPCLLPPPRLYRFLGQCPGQRSRHLASPVARLVVCFNHVQLEVLPCTDAINEHTTSQVGSHLLHAQTSPMLQLFGFSHTRTHEAVMILSLLPHISSSPDCGTRTVCPDEKHIPYDTQCPVRAAVQLSLAKKYSRGARQTFASQTSTHTRHTSTFLTSMIQTPSEAAATRIQACVRMVQSRKRCALWRCHCAVNHSSHGDEFLHCLAPPAMNDSTLTHIGNLVFPVWKIVNILLHSNASFVRRTRW